jgi:uncharacterized linocin/CFP29 family protein
MSNQNDVSIDTINASGGGFSGMGAVASALLGSKFNVNSLRTNDVLRKNEWELFDQTVVQVARQRLVGVGDLLSRGLRLPVANALGITRVEWEKVSDMGPAEINMSGLTEGQGDRVTYALEGTPLPIIHKDFKINIRALEASRNMGQSLDTTQASLAARLVSERTETMLFDGYASIQMQGSTVRGYKTAPNRNTGSISNWALVGTTGETIVAEVLAMILALQGDNYNGPYGLYVPIDYYNKLLGDFKANSDKSILTRLLEMPDLEFIKISRNLPGGAAGQVIMVQLTADVVDMIDGMQPTTLQWESNGGMVVNFKVMAIMAPRMKSDAASQSGIAHYSV